MKVASKIASALTGKRAPNPSSPHHICHVGPKPAIHVHAVEDPTTWFLFSAEAIIVGRGELVVPSCSVVSRGELVDSYSSAEKHMEKRTAMVKFPQPKLQRKSSLANSDAPAHHKQDLERSVRHAEACVCHHKSRQQSRNKDPKCRDTKKTKNTCCNNSFIWWQSSRNNSEHWVSRLQAWKPVSARFWKSQSTNRRQEHLAPDNWKRPEHQAPRDRSLHKILSYGKKFHLHPDTNGEKYTKKFDDPAKNFKPQKGRTRILQSITDNVCATFGKDPSNLQNCPLNVVMWCQLKSGCLWASCWPSKKGRFQKDGDESKISKDTRFDTSCPTTNENIDRSHRRIQLADIGGLEHISKIQTCVAEWCNRRCWMIQPPLLNDPTAKLIKTKVHVFSDSTLSVGVSNSDPSNTWATILEDLWNEHGLVENLNLAAREVQCIWHVPPSASTIDIKKHMHKYLINCMSMFNNTERTTKSNTETCLRNAKKWHHVQPKIQATTLVLPEVCIKMYVVERTRHSNEPER